MEAVLPNVNNYESRALKRKGGKIAVKIAIIGYKLIVYAYVSVNTRQAIIPYSECKKFTILWHTMQPQGTRII